jgi:hypothetical protein
MESDTESARPTPKAFISYSWSDEPHKAWVKALAIQLRRDGVDVTLDQCCFLDDENREFVSSLSIRGEAPRKLSTRALRDAAGMHRRLVDKVVQPLSLLRGPAQTEKDLRVKLPPLPC